MSTVHHIYIHPIDSTTTGLMIICKSKDHFVAEYIPKGINEPIGVSEYELKNHFPRDFKVS